MHTCIHEYIDIAYIDVCLLCLLLLDAAHVARMKARADAEFYTAVRLAEANKVLWPVCKGKCMIIMTSQYLSLPYSLSIVCSVGSVGEQYVKWPRKTFMRSMALAWYSSHWAPFFFSSHRFRRVPTQAISGWTPGTECVEVINGWMDFISEDLCNIILTKSSASLIIDRFSHGIRSLLSVMSYLIILLLCNYIIWETITKVCM